MAYIMVDIESDGPIPGDYSMISFGAVLVDAKLDQTFYGKLKPISDNFKPEALSVSGHSREETMTFEDPIIEMTKFKDWIKEVCNDKPIFISDNNGFDWMFVCWYFHHFLGENPFGYSSQNMGSLYKGLVQDTTKNFKHLRKTKHTHNPVDDAIGNAEALIYMKKTMKLEIDIKID
jgi:3' exoribonuclease, RNase T-like